MTVIYLQEHDCSPKQEEDKPSKEELENILRIKPTKSAGQLQWEVVREALLSTTYDPILRRSVKCLQPNGPVKIQRT